ncbi:uracil-DNA glycosylase [Geomonas subterranea]|uniref:Uracil-DNA glycosylase n=1 Tax=Geomonas subterranea TaxID=2847989 RepID=A0ABX8LHS8_9BACT|nr:uracil-DNA glycosylase family protein [Geomonas subterranea]QXE91595.1 uracil-DNA glycosylase [Geomonas subterranea]QXM10314.1 uracil-DNA glycosylase [Geomonas subterranea]
MAEMEERELLLRSLKGYLTDLADSGVEELSYGPPTAAPPAPVTAPPAGAGTPAPAAAAPVAEAAPAAVVSPSASGADVAGPAATGALCRQEGNPRARLLFLMAGPGYAGAAGDLLTRIIAGMKFSTGDVCLISFDAGGDAALTAGCVAQRIAAVEPEVVVALGEEAAGLILPGVALEKVRGCWHDAQGRGVMPTLHPDALLANEGLKRLVWEDMKLVMRRLAGAP